MTAERTQHVDGLPATTRKLPAAPVNCVLRVLCARILYASGRYTRCPACSGNSRVNLCDSLKTRPYYAGRSLLTSFILKLLLTSVLRMREIGGGSRGRTGGCRPSHPLKPVNRETNLNETSQKYNSHRETDFHSKHTC